MENREYLHIEDKHDNYDLFGGSIEQVALHLLKERVKEGWYVSGEPGDQERAEDIARAEDGAAALGFLLARRDYEYEWVEVRTMREVP